MSSILHCRAFLNFPKFPKTSEIVPSLTESEIVLLFNSIIPALLISIPLCFNISLYADEILANSPLSFLFPINFELFSSEVTLMILLYPSTRWEMLRMIASVSFLKLIVTGDSAVILLKLSSKSLLIIWVFVLEEYSTPSIENIALAGYWDI